MTEAISGSQWEAKYEGIAAKEFADHQVKVIGRGHWFLSRKGERRGMYWTHVVAMDSGLAVWGDIDACVFAYHTGTPVQLVRWVSGMVAGSYAREKAGIGMSSYEIAEDFEAGVAVYDLKSRLKDLPEDHGEAWEFVGSTVTGAFEDAIDAVERGVHPIEWRSQLVSDLEGVDADAWEWVGSIGRVTSTRVIFALAAVKRLDELLKDLVYEYEEE